MLWCNGSLFDELDDDDIEIKEYEIIEILETRFIYIEDLDKIIGVMSFSQILRYNTSLQS